MSEPIWSCGSSLKGVTHEELAREAAQTIVLCLGVAVVAVILSDVLARWLPLPTVVLEILGGIVIGPAVLGIATDNLIVSSFSELGLAVLMFLAGYELQLSRIAGAPLRSACTGWVASLLIGLAAGITVVKLAGPEQDVSSGVMLGLIFTTTALGTILPILRDAGELDTRFGSVVVAAGAVGEFGPILAIALLLSGQSPLRTVLVLIIFAGVAAIALAMASRPRSPRLGRLLSHTLTTSGQLGVRMAMFIVILLAWIAGHLGLDVLLGAFIAGLVARLFLSGVDEHAQEQTIARLEGAGYGFLVPIFFVVSGIRFDLDSLLASPFALVMIPLSLVAFLLIRGVPTYVALRGTLSGRERTGASIYTATALPLIVVITTIGVDSGELTRATAAALVGAGMVSVLVFPLIATHVRGVSTPPSAGKWAGTSDAL